MNTKRIKIKEDVVINVAIGDTIIGKYIGTVKINAKWKPSRKAMINKMKKARTTEEARDLRETYNGKPHACIQWKGTDVCMDVHCKCGEHFHIDADFAYHVKCPKCKTVYFCNGYIELIELEVEPYWCVETEETDIMETEIVFPVNNDLLELIRKVSDE